MSKSLTYSEEPDFPTQVVLMEAYKCGVKAICISMSHPIVKESTTFVFGANGSIFCNEEIDGWPAAWKVAENSHIFAGCGNSNQAQVYWRAPPSVWSRIGKHWRKLA